MFMEATGKLENHCDNVAAPTMIDSQSSQLLHVLDVKSSSDFFG